MVQEGLSVKAVNPRSKHIVKSNQRSANLDLRLEFRPELGLSVVESSSTEPGLSAIETSNLS